jgi:hypothetical protein
MFEERGTKGERMETSEADGKEEAVEKLRQTHAWLLQEQQGN